MVPGYPGTHVPRCRQSGGITERSRHCNREHYLFRKPENSLDARLSDGTRNPSEVAVVVITHTPDALSSATLTVAGLGWVAIGAVPFVKYPANPPAVGDPETIDQRTWLWVVLGLGRRDDLGRGKVGGHRRDLSRTVASRPDGRAVQGAEHVQQLHGHDRPCNRRGCRNWSRAMDSGGRRPRDAGAGHESCTPQTG